VREDGEGCCRLGKRERREGGTGTVVSYVGKKYVAFAAVRVTALVTALLLSIS